MKKLIFVVALLLSGFSVSAQAATATGTFNVLINLTSKCEINSTNAATGALITDLTFDYTSFQTAPATPTTSFNVRCTNTLPYALSLDATSVTDNATNLAYTLALSGATATGTGANQVITVTGTMAAGQSGTCGTTAVCTNAAATNKQRMLTVTY